MASKKETQEQPTQEETQDQPKSAYDIRIDALEKKLSDLETKYMSEKEEWQKANRELYGIIQSAPSPPPRAETGAEPPREPSVDGFLKAFKH